MANSFVQYSADGANYSIPFQFISKAHIHAYVDGVEVPFSWLSVNTVTLSVVPPQGAVIEIRRITPSNALIVDYIDGSILTSTDLDLSATHSLFLAQETEDTADTAVKLGSDGNYDFSGRRAINAADPINPQDLVTKAWSETGMSSQLALANAARSGAQTASQDAAAARNAAGTSRDAAGASQRAAKGSEDAAAGSASSAAGSAGTATQQASNAGGSAQAAAGSATAAKNSQDAAKASADAAAGSAGSASVSAGQADGSAKAAAASATNSDRSASASLAAALRAEQAADNAATGGYTKAETDAKLADKADKSSTYTKTQVDDKVTAATGGKADASAVYTKAQVDTAVGAKLDKAAGGEVSGKAVFSGTDIPGITGLEDFNGLSNAGALQIASKGTVQQSIAAMEFWNKGRGSLYLALDWDFTLKLGGGAYGNKAYRLFHQGNLNPIQSLKLVMAGDAAGTDIAPVTGGILEKFPGAVLTGAGGRADAFGSPSIWAVRWRYLQVQDQNGNWVTVSYEG